jgi:hypothetical protein
MNKILATSVAVALSVPAYALDDPTNPIIGWSWTCSGKVYYHMDVSQEENPNGNYKAIGEVTVEKLKIEIKKSSKSDGIYVGDICHYLPDAYYLEIHTEIGSWLFDSGWQSPCTQKLIMTGNYPKEARELEQVEAALIKPHNLTLNLNRDDIEWRFLIAKPSLMTLRRSRELRVKQPNAGTNFDPSAGVSFITGQCIMEHDQPLY